ncbi:MAG: ATP-binding protein [Rhodocyclaceae bacterium]|nr:ATP-binding protein [Rhodocyclaceae bacterium]MDZ4214643.1 ATP-binding protein [Rhodocyclaceae bacterium]
MALEPSLVQQLSTRFGPGVHRSTLSVDEQGNIWRADPQFGQLARVLQDIVDRLELSSLFVVNAAGDCIAEGHSGDGKSFTGVNYADRDYFRDAQKGLLGQQFAVGRVSNAYALFYSAPVISKNQFIGAVATRVDLEKITRSIAEEEFFLTDENGVIVLAKDPDLLMRALPNAKIFEISNKDREARYKRQQFSTVELQPLGGKEPAQLFRWNNARQPYVLATQTISDNLLTVHVLNDMDAISQIRRERIGWFSLVTLLGLAMLLLVAGALHHYRNLLQQRRQQEQLLTRLKESNERSTALFNATHDAVILLDGERLVSIDCNPQALTMFGATDKEKSLGLPPWSPLFTPPFQPDGAASEAYARQQGDEALRHGTQRFDYTYKRIDTDENFQVDVMLTAIQLNGKLILQAVLRDISERIRFERQIQSANAELSRRNEEQDRFLSMLSHELKTPLSVIRMSLSNHNETIDSASRTRLIRAVADINAIVERCLQTDRLAHGRVELMQARCNPGDILHQVVSACSEPARVRVEAAPLPDCLTDAQLLTVIFANLIDNALKYSPADAAITIRAEALMRDGQAGLSFRVTNPPGNAGMPDPQQVFRRYYRAPGAHGKTGSGLGLHLAEGFTRMLGGDLSYQPEAGTVKFALWIPC